MTFLKIKTYMHACMHVSSHISGVIGACITMICDCYKIYVNVIDPNFVSDTIGYVISVVFS